MKPHHTFLTGATQEKSLAAILGITYISPSEQNADSQNAHLSRDSTQSAFEILAGRTWHDSEGENCTDETQWFDSEAESLVSWAKQERCLIDTESWNKAVSQWKVLEGAAEHSVFLASDGERVVKSTIPPNFGLRSSVSEYAKNALWSNQLFGDDIQFLGVLEDTNGVSIVSTQPFYKGESPSETEIENWFTSQGYEIAGHNRWKHPITGVEIADTHTGNFIKASDGSLFPIDVQVLHPGTVSEI